MGFVMRGLSTSIMSVHHNLLTIMPHDLKWSEILVKASVCIINNRSYCALVGTGDPWSFSPAIAEFNHMITYHTNFISKGYSFLWNCVTHHIWISFKIKTISAYIRIRKMDMTRYGMTSFEKSCKSKSVKRV